jgi:cytochrome c oxidase subunit IV
MVSNIDKIGTKINESDLFGKSNFKINISEIVGFVRWILILVFMIIAADVMQWSLSRSVICCVIYPYCLVQLHYS